MSSSVPAAASMIIPHLGCLLYTCYTMTLGRLPFISSREKYYHFQLCVITSLPENCCPRQSVYCYVLRFREN